jgi:hypothetical protein
MLRQKRPCQPLLLVCCQLQLLVQYHLHLLARIHSHVLVIWQLLVQLDYQQQLLHRLSLRMACRSLLSAHLLAWKWVLLLAVVLVGGSCLRCLKA